MNWIPPCTADQTADACAKANGWPDPFQFNMQSGSAAPENAVTGFGPASFYFRTGTSKLYVFGGTPGTEVGWNILN